MNTTSCDLRVGKKRILIQAWFFVACLLLGSPGNAFARSYATDFSSAENPISEGGNWINGASVGVDWADIAVTNGMAIGLESGSTGYDDATALLTGIWGPNQTASATVFATHRMSGNVYEEVEIRLRSSLSPHSCTGYEVLFSLKPDAGCYVQIVRWNGPLGDFTYVATTGGPQYVLHSGDSVKASVTNQTITAYINGTAVLQGTDTHFASGSPGIGIFIQGATGVNQDYGLTSFTATDGLPTSTPPRLAISSLTNSGALALRLTGESGVHYDLQVADNLNNPNWLSLDNLAPDESGEVWFTNAAPSGVTSQFYRAVSQ